MRCPDAGPPIVEGGRADASGGADNGAWLRCLHVLTQSAGRSQADVNRANWAYLWEP